MSIQRPTRWLTLLVFSYGLSHIVALADEPGRSGEALLTVNGTVLMPDGSPASGATVESTGELGEPLRTTQADRSGEFQLRGIFGDGVRLHARSEDGRYQAVRLISSAAARSVLAEPVELRLEPAEVHEVTVLAEGRPVDGAWVVASGNLFQVHGLTGPEGKARLWIPTQERVERLVAWHEKLGVQGVQVLDAGLPQDGTRLSLNPPEPLTIRAIDPDGQPIRGLELAISVQAGDSDWSSTGEIEEAHARTGVDGAVTVAWIPREQLKFVDVEIIGSDWKPDSRDLSRISDRIVVVRARRRIPIEGRLAMPEGASAEGLLITGFGFGPGDHGDVPGVRARADGSFILRVPSDHAYVLGVVDLQWASDPWTGLVLDQDRGKPAEITMPVQPATPMTVRVTRGEPRAPVANAGVHVESVVEFEWVDASGEKRAGQAGASTWLKTDGDGVAQTGVGRGQYNVVLFSDRWYEERGITVASREPVDVDFHRAWPGKRRVTGQLVSEGERFEPSASLVAHAWVQQLPRPYPPLRFQPEMGPDGTFKVEFDTATLALFFSDPGKRRSGFAQVGLEGSSIEVNMEPMATVSGTLRDENGQPWADQPLSLRLSALTTSGDPIATIRTD